MQSATDQVKLDALSTARIASGETSASGRYLLGDSSEEIRHLVEQAEVYAVDHFVPRDR
jgi:hypothetical protein